MSERNESPATAPAEGRMRAFAGNSFDDYYIELDYRKDTSNRPYDVYVVRDNLTKMPEYEDRDYDNVFRYAVQLQERISAKKVPESFVKVPLISIGTLSVYRTVRNQKGVLVWTYIAENKSDGTLLEACNYIDLCMKAVNFECSKLDKCKHVLRGCPRAGR